MEDNRKKKRKTGQILPLFSVFDDAHSKVKCNLCKQIFSYKSTVSNLHKHIKVMHPTIEIRPPSTKRARTPKNLVKQEIEILETVESATITIKPEKDEDCVTENANRDQHKNADQTMYADQCSTRISVPSVSEEKNELKINMTQIFCRSIRIGTYKCYPIHDSEHINVVLGFNSICFEVPELETEGCNLKPICLKGSGIVEIAYYFSRGLQCMFISTSTKCAENIRLKLGMIKGSPLSFDPESKYENQRLVTLFLVDNFAGVDPLKQYLNSFFPDILRHINKFQDVNQILVNSCPDKNDYGKERAATRALEISSLEVVVLPSTCLQKNTISSILLKGSNDVSKVNQFQVAKNRNSTGVPPLTQHAVSSSLSSLLIPCYFIRLGLMKITSTDKSNALSLYLTPETLVFSFPPGTGMQPRLIILDNYDIEQVIASFGSPSIIVIGTTTSCANRIKNILGPIAGSLAYFDPNSRDLMLKNITFLTKSLKKETVSYLQKVFPGKLQEIKGSSAISVLKWMGEEPGIQHKSILPVKACTSTDTEKRKHNFFITKMKDGCVENSYELKFANDSPKISTSIGLSNEDRCFINETREIPETFNNFAVDKKHLGFQNNNDKSEKDVFFVENLLKTNLNNCHYVFKSNMEQNEDDDMHFVEHALERKAEDNMQFVGNNTGGNVLHNLSNNTPHFSKDPRKVPMLNMKGLLKQNCISADLSDNSVSDDKRTCSNNCDEHAILKLKENCDLSLIHSQGKMSSSVNDSLSCSSVHKSLNQLENHEYFDDFRQ